MEPRASTALTTAGMAALRRAAVMAHTVGTISLRLSSNGERIVDVRPDAMDVAVRPCRGRVIDPCGFRMAVARAWADHEAGREIGLIGVGPQDELSMEWSVAAPGHDLGFGAVRAACGGRMVWAFASVLGSSELTDVMRTLDGDHDDIVARTIDGLAARLVHDELLGATVVHVEADPPGSATTRVLDEVLRRMVSVVGATELVEAFAGAGRSRF